MSPQAIAKPEALPGCGNECLKGTPQLVAGLLGSGLRLLECLQLRIKDLDFGYGHIVVRAGKGKKDRIVPLPRTLITALREQLEKARTIHEADIGRGGARRFVGRPVLAE